MEHDTISVLRINLYDCETRPSDILRPLIPKNATREAWIPQTVGDQIWVLYEFKTKQDREAWEADLPPKVSRWLDRNLIQVALYFDR